MYRSRLLSSVSVHPSWNDFITNETSYIIENLKSIEQKIGNNYTPTDSEVLRFFGLDLSKIKIIILGQDPYKPVGVANGRAFQPKDLLDWSQPFRQVSLKNIIRSIYAAYNNITEWDLIPSYKEIVHEMEIGEFKLKQPYSWFDSLESQGVLLLNTSLTCEIGKSNSHKDIWKEFACKLISHIAYNCPQSLDWFLWGNEAQFYKDIVQASNTERQSPHRLFLSRHPMMCTRSSTDDFLYNPCFKETMNKMNWLG